VEFIAEAFTQAASIGVQWRQYTTLENVASSVAPAQNVVRLVGEKLRQSGVKFDNFPDNVVALLSLPPDGSLARAAGQPPSPTATP
jgi:hypothetical protein